MPDNRCTWGWFPDSRSENSLLFTISRAGFSNSPLTGPEWRKSVPKTQSKALVSRTWHICMHFTEPRSTSTSVLPIEWITSPFPTRMYIVSCGSITALRVYLFATAETVAPVSRIVSRLWPWILESRQEVRRKFSSPNFRFLSCWRFGNLSVPLCVACGWSRSVCRLRCSAFWRLSCFYLVQHSDS